MMRRFVRLATTVSVVALALAGCEFLKNASNSCASSGTSGGSFSRDGRYLAFQSFCTNDTVVGGPLTGVHDEDVPYPQVFVRDLRDGTVEGVSYATDGGSGDDASSGAQLSGNGRRVAFTSNASDLVAGDDTTHDADVFVRDLGTGTTTRVSVNTTGGDGDGASFAPVISDDGNLVVFNSSATNLVTPAPAAGTHVYLRNLNAGTTTLVAMPPTLEGHTSVNAISADGRYVVVTSDTDRVYVRDLQLGTTAQASLNRNGDQPNSSSGGATISGDGRFVAFVSFASDLVTGDGNGAPDVFVRDMQSSTTRLISVDATGGEANNWSRSAAISRDGRFVAFSSDATDLVTDDVHGIRQAYVRDIASAHTSLLSATAEGEAATVATPETGVAISGDGRYASFVSRDQSLDGGSGSFTDVWAHSTTRPVVTAVTPAAVARGTTRTLTVTGTGFFGNTRASVSGSGVTVTNIVFVNAKTLQVTVAVAADAATGARNLGTTNPGTGPGAAAGASDTCAGCLTVS
jgi:Tol biopolymer transport system component